MALQFELENLDDIPEALKSEYTQDETTKKYRLNVEGVVPKSRLDQFRATNTKISKERDELIAKYKDIDPEEARRLRDQFKDIDLEEIKSLREELAALKESGGKEKQQTKAELETRIAELKGASKKELEALAAKHAAEKTVLEGTVAARTAELAKEKIENQVQNLAVQNSVLASALDDIKLRAEKIFSLQDGQVVAHKGDGTKWISDATDKYLTPAEWFKILIKEAPHLFKGSEGTGSTGGTKGKQTTDNGTTNPWKADTYNRTRQAAIVKEDLEKARRYAKEAGVKVLF